MMLAPLIEKLTASEDLVESEVDLASRALLAEDVSLEHKADFLRALHRKGEKPAEIAAFVQVFLANARRPELLDQPILDLCGTGGDRLGLFNISTATMFVVAACGVRVVKHGNRGVTSKSGGADVLEALGVRLDHDPGDVQRVLDQAGCLFLFAPVYHPAFKAVAPVRKALADEGTPTIFNMLGPLLNPARPSLQMAGVFHEQLLPIYAETFRLLGRHRAWAVHGRVPTGGLDEVSTLGETRVLALENGELTERIIRPDDFPLGSVTLANLLGGDARHNARLIHAVLQGDDRGPICDIILLNAAAALVVAGVADDMLSGFERAREAVDSGRASHVLARLRDLR